ncbi:hypothetical protein CKO31_17495 [Thiohalocapsa halophila]|uniref:Uncharacterized protein n=1 Tax=Thiohalocapsa halophila TaxID=69359 RepID=A0ABS1CLD5_9GAMM|nr:hypothetical protein [Thiohalocapsa halophila]MBK1632503.1 hypothetical protein [Thiohalocapsa halophila]
MTRGIRLKAHTHTDLGHPGLAPGTLQGGIQLADGDQTPDAESIAAETIAIAREVRQTLETVFDILSAALPPERG